MKNVFQGFKDFISQGSALDLAVGVVIGVAFAELVGAIQTHLINPIIGAIFGESSLSTIWYITLNNDGAQISVGGLLNAVVHFLIVAAAIYFVIVLPMNKLRSLRKTNAPEAPAPSEDVVLLQEIRDLLAAQK